MEKIADNLSDEKYNIPVSDEQYIEMNKFSNDVNISNIEFRESTAHAICEQYDIEKLMD